MFTLSTPAGSPRISLKKRRGEELAAARAEGARLWLTTLLHRFAWAASPSKPWRIMSRTISMVTGSTGGVSSPRGKSRCPVEERGANAARLRGHTLTGKQPQCRSTVRLLAAPHHLACSSSPLAVDDSCNLQQHRHVLLPPSLLPLNASFQSGLPQRAGHRC